MEKTQDDFISEGFKKFMSEVNDDLIERFSKYDIILEKNEYGYDFVKYANSIMGNLKVNEMGVQEPDLVLFILKHSSFISQMTFKQVDDEDCIVIEIRNKYGTLVKGLYQNQKFFGEGQTYVLANLIKSIAGMLEFSLSNEVLKNSLLSGDKTEIENIHKYFEFIDNSVLVVLKSIREYDYDYYLLLTTEIGAPTVEEFEEKLRAKKLLD